MIELGKLYLPLMIDYKSKNKTITLRIPDCLEEEYLNDFECSLHLNIDGSDVFINYYCENDIYLSELLGLKDNCIAHGDIRNERFETIQERALKVLSKYIDEAQQELFEHFDKI